MVNEDIVTSLRNAVQHGESLQEAMNILVHSGYNINEVQEASKFVTNAPQTIGSMQVKPEQELIMPSQKKSFLSGFSDIFKKKSGTPSGQISQQARPSTFSQPAQLPQEILEQQIQQQSQQPTLPPLQSQQPTPSPAQSQQQIVQQPPLVSPQPTLPTPQPSQKAISQVQHSTIPQPSQFPQQLQQPSKSKKGFFHKKSLSRELRQIKPPKKSHKKEIMLLLILLLLIGILIFTITFRETILGWFS